MTRCGCAKTRREARTSVFKVSALFFFFSYSCFETGRVHIVDAWVVLEVGSDQSGSQLHLASNKVSATSDETGQNG